MCLFNAQDLVIIAFLCHNGPLPSLGLLSLNTTGRDRKPCPFPVVKFHLFILGVVVIHDLVVGVVVLAALVTLGAALLAGLGGVALGRLLLIQLLAHLVEQLGQLLGGGLDGVGVSVSGLEMTQNSIKLSWSAEEVDEKLKSIMKNIHEACVQYGTEADGYVNYVKGANVAGFMKVAKAMMAQGIL